MVNKDKVKEKAMQLINHEFEKNGYIRDSNEPMKSHVQLMITIAMTQIYPQSIVDETDKYSQAMGEIYADILATLHERYHEYDEINNATTIRYFTLLEYKNTEDFKTRVGL
jgi:hypothetical protein